jgi:dephospho-CoA kinase
MSKGNKPSNTSRIVIGIAGRMGAGKTTAARYVAAKYAFQYLRYSQVLSDWMTLDPESKSDLQEAGWKVMAEGAQAELNRRLIANVKAQTNAVVDGLRHRIDYESLKDSFAHSFHLLYIDTPREERWKRLRARGVYANPEDFDLADSHPVEQQIGSLRAYAALIIPNEGSLQDLYVALDRAIRDFERRDHT